MHKRIRFLSAVFALKARGNECPTFFPTFVANFFLIIFVFHDLVLGCYFHYREYKFTVFSYFHFS